MHNTPTTRATGTYEVKSWDEKPYEELEEGAKLTRASVTETFQGDIEGESTVEFLMMYLDATTASYVGMQRVVGRLGGRSGSFVLQVSGTFEGGLAQATWSVVPGSGTGELRGLRGEGGFPAQHGTSNVPYTLDYSFE
ncbi:MAG TPA: DUF3224 domain-containing protein [Chloroflexia bacterium]|jgi:hypothetical protein